MAKANPFGKPAGNGKAPGKVTKATPPGTNNAATGKTGKGNPFAKGGKK